VNFVNAEQIAQTRGIAIAPRRTQAARLREPAHVPRVVRRDETAFPARLHEKNQRIVSVNNFRVEFKPEGTSLYIINRDVPAWSAASARLLGDREVNIAEYNLARSRSGGTAMAIVTIDSAARRRRAHERLRVIRASRSAAAAPVESTRCIIESWKTGNRASARSGSARGRSAGRPGAAGTPLGGEDSDDESLGAIRRARELGVQLLRIRRLLRLRPQRVAPRHRVVADAQGRRHRDEGRRGARRGRAAGQGVSRAITSRSRSMARSKRLRTDYIDLYQLHNPTLDELRRR
jgi:DNA-binding transcriptional MerR regulator